MQHLNFYKEVRLIKRMTDRFTFRDKSANIGVVLMRKSKSGSQKIMRYDFSFKNIQDITTFLSMNDSEPVSFNDEETLTHKDFMDSYFSNANRIYTNRETEFIDRVYGSYSSGTLGRDSKIV